MKLLYSSFLGWIFVLITNLPVYSQSCTLTAKCTGGNWDDPNTWTASASCGAVTAPTDACIILIPVCATVNINLNSPEYNNMEIYVYGTMNFGSGQKINMCPGYIKVYPGGQLTGGTPGSKINICGSTVYNGGATASGPFELGGGTSLPVDLVSFNAVYTNGKVAISWTTASEMNNDYFTIERSRNGLDFDGLMQVDAAGNSSSLIDYEETDFYPYEGISYYRLKQTDFNGAVKYSNVITVNYIFGNDGFTIYPNPSSPNSTVFMDLGFPEGKEVLVVVRDIQGKEFFSKVIINSHNDQLTAVDPNNQIAAGTYVIVATSDNKIFSQTLVVR